MIWIVLLISKFHYGYVTMNYLWERIIRQWWKTLLLILVVWTYSVVKLYKNKKELQKKEKEVCILKKDKKNIAEQS